MACPSLLGARSIVRPPTHAPSPKRCALKAEHGVSPAFEAKWTKVSPGKFGFYIALVDLFLAPGFGHLVLLLIGVSCGS